MTNKVPSILFSTPCYGNMVTAAYTESMISVIHELDKVGITWDFSFGKNESLIHRARNAMAYSFLQTDYDYLFWVDADIEFTPMDVNKMWELCEGPIQAPIAVGVYAMKKRNEQWFAAWKDGQLIQDLDQFKGPVEVDFAGTGFMMIKRHVIEELTKVRGTYAANWGRKVVRHPALYMAGIHNDYLESEDYHFCRVARENGFKVWMDPTVRLGHIGQYRYGA